MLFVIFNFELKRYEGPKPKHELTFPPLDKKVENENLDLPNVIRDEAETSVETVYLQLWHKSKFWW